MSMSGFKQHRAVIVALVCARHEVSELELFGPKKSQALLKPRFEAIWLMRRFTRMSVAALGRAAGGRDHSSILGALKRIETMTALDAGYADDLVALAAEAVRRLTEAGLYRRDQDLSDVDALEVAMLAVASSGARNSFEWREFLAVSKAYLAATQEIEAMRAAVGQLKTQASKIESGEFKHA